MEYNGEKYYYFYDATGNVQGLFDSSGTAVANYYYTAYGEPLLIESGFGLDRDVSADPTHIANINPFRYKSYYYDTETGFYYLNTRYYDPTVCRFLSMDSYASTGQGVIGHNMYAYCGNNPVSRVDDKGEFWNVIIGAAIGFATSLVSNVIDVATEIITKEPDEDIDYGKLFGSAVVSLVIGTVEGALTGAFPAAAVAISAAAGATEAIVTGAIKGTPVRDVAIDAVVSGGIGALTGAMGMGAGNNNEDLYDSAAKAVKKLKGGKLSPTAKKAAKNEIKKAAKAV